MTGHAHAMPTLMRSGMEAASVEVSVPAHPSLVATIRSVARAASLLAELPLGESEALQIAVDEAAILLLPLVATKVADARLCARFEIEAGRVRVALEAPCRDGASLDCAGMAWMVLTGLDPDVCALREERTMTISFQRGRTSGAERA